jgi:hypothetical protein
MYLDKANMFSDKQDVVASGYSTDTVEIPRAAPGSTLEIALHVAVRSEAGTNPTLVVELETSDDNSTFTKVVGLSKTAGQRVVGCSLHNMKLSRYLRIRYVLGGSSPAYNITAALVLGEQANRAYPDSPRIS